jgi:hypothetical protein
MREGHQLALLRELEASEEKGEKTAICVLGRTEMTYYCHLGALLVEDCASSVLQEQKQPAKIERPNDDRRIRSYFCVKTSQP